MEDGYRVAAGEGGEGCVWEGGVSEGFVGVDG